ncbi:DUF171-domain-containing protein [Lepidopterella palustris CBS 459.81]|uniref:DUF171-domain-containing protein n=1 Tax=Lepidopterella palustris CBS 459.81 TaxID=1314670 RepID=A0A8E2E449_9PEZI|nr:DUF171-domain-containing protein [Lepidopterella palustris CBS 459.81]
MSTNTKKRKRSVVLHHAEGVAGGLDTSKPTAVFQPKEGRDWTLSIALPGSIIANAQTYDLKLALAGQIARASSVFCVDEIVVFSDAPATQKSLHSNNNPDDEPWKQPDQFLYHVFSYLETPPHLRRKLFPMHPSLRGAGTLPSLDLPHHLRSEEWCQYREGVTVAADEAQHAAFLATSLSPVKKQKKNSTPKSNAKPSAVSPFSDSDTNVTKTTFVDAGLASLVPLPGISIPPSTRLTLKFPTAPTAPSSFPALTPADISALAAEAVAPSAPREEAGYYWGFTPRRCASLSAVFTDCPWEGGYDFSIGTSERGIPLSDLTNPGSTPTPPSTPLPKSFKHLILIFGGVAGLEAAVSADPELAARGISKERASDVFDAWVNLVPGQGSRTIRTEEAVWVGLMGLMGYVGGNLA